MGKAVGLTCLTFVFKFIGNVYLGLQLPAVSNALVAAGHTMALAGMALAQWSGGLGFLGVGVLYTAAPLVIQMPYSYSFRQANVSGTSSNCTSPIHPFTMNEAAMLITIFLLRVPL